MKRLSAIAVGLVFVAIAYLFYATSWGTLVAEFIKHPKQVGALLPTSRFVAEEITKFIRASDNGIKILEAGAGTGPITEVIVTYLKSNDTLDVVEIDPAFCKILQEKFGNNPKIAINCTSITDWQPPYKYDIIISTIPFSALKADPVAQILNKYREFIKPNGIMSYVEYMGASSIRNLFLNKEDKQDLVRKRTLLADLQRVIGLGTVNIWLNIPPCYVHHLRLGAQ